MPLGELLLRVLESQIGDYDVLSDDEEATPRGRQHIVAGRRINARRASDHGHGETRSDRDPPDQLPAEILVARFRMVATESPQGVHGDHRTVGAKPRRREPFGLNPLGKSGNTGFGGHRAASIRALGHGRGALPRGFGRALQGRAQRWHSCIQGISRPA